MAKQNILVGAVANDKTGDTLRNAFVKVNANFTELYTLTGGTAADLQELAQDYAAPLFNHASHTNITATYDDANNKILLTGVAAQVQSNWTASSGLGVILNKPTLFSGSYTDLTNKPTIPAVQIQSDWTQASNVALDFIKNKPTLFSGSYTDLTNKPTIPTSFSSLVNGAYTASLGSTGILTLSNGAIATTVDNNATVNTSATVTTNNSYTNTTDFSTDVDLGGGSGVIAGWYQRNSEQIEFALFGPSAFQTYLTGLALGRTVIVTYSTSGGNQTLTRTLTQAFTATGQFDPANPTWGRVSGRIDATLPAGQTGIVSINFPVYSTSSKTWTFGTDGKQTAPGNLQVDGGKIILNTGGNAYVESVDYGVNSANSAVNIFGGPYQKIKLRAGFGTQATWTLGTDGTLTFPDATVQSTAYLAPTTGNSVIDSINPLTISRNGMTIRVTSAGMIQMSFNSVINITGRSSINNADSVVIASPNGVTTASTQYNIGAVLALGDHLTATIVDHSFHRIYRLTVIIRSKDTTPGLELVVAYAIIEQIQ